MKPGACGPREARYRATLVAAGLVALLAMGAGGCLWSSGGTVEQAEERVDVLVYAVDVRTHLCFATLYWLGETRSITYVPCTAEVVTLARSRSDRSAKAPPPDGGAR